MEREILSRLIGSRVNQKVDGLLTQLEIAREGSSHGSVRAPAAALFVLAAERPARQAEDAREAAYDLQGQSTAPAAGSRFRVFRRRTFATRRE